MELILRRVALMDTYTIGRLSVNGVYFCDTLEDKVRDFNKDGDLLDDGEQKVYGETAIPYGTYTIEISYSPRFKRMLPRLLNVRQFEGILIHAGNTAKDTHGCILVGRNTEKGKVTNSKATFDRLFTLMKDEKDITIQII